MSLTTPERKCPLNGKVMHESRIAARIASDWSRAVEPRYCPVCEHYHIVRVGERQEPTAEEVRPTPGVRAPARTTGKDSSG